MRGGLGGGGGTGTGTGDGTGDGDGVFPGTEEEEGPVVFLGMVGDAGGDLFPGETLGGVFLTLGENGDDDLVWAMRLWERGEALFEDFEGVADGVE